MTDEGVDAAYSLISQVNQTEYEEPAIEYSTYLPGDFIARVPKEIGSLEQMHQWLDKNLANAIKERSQSSDLKFSSREMSLVTKGLWSYADLQFAILDYETDPDRVDRSKINANQNRKDGIKPTPHEEDKAYLIGQEMLLENMGLDIERQTIDYLYKKAASVTSGGNTPNVIEGHVKPKLASKNNS